MRTALLLAFALFGSPAFAEYFEVARKDGAALSISVMSEGVANFRLALGVNSGDDACIEGNVDCLTIEGGAWAEGGGYAFKDPDSDGSGFTIYSGHMGYEIADVYGDFGVGTANAAAVSRIAGFYDVDIGGGNAQDAPAIEDYRASHNIVTPSGNIECVTFYYGGQESLRCDMGALTSSFTNKPADCPADWGSAFGMASTGNAQVLCHGDTIVGPEQVVLQYGVAIQYGSFNCTSEKTGLTCVNLDGHGFTLSKARQTLF
jgi:hypothetical protein